VIGNVCSDAGETFALNPNADIHSNPAENNEKSDILGKTPRAERRRQVACGLEKGEARKGRRA